MEHDQSVAGDVVLAVEVGKAEEVNQWGRGRVHEDYGEDDDVKRVHVAETVDVVCAVFAVVTQLRILLIGEVDVHDFRHDIACLEQRGEDGKR